ncbi:hypothetical protein BDZ89DRAFT_1165245 [Hymenopellis radicata]|nr:hypothetical protein BDZ89DRAFT_1165245 [Hymenopellis radicata]
MSKSSRASFSRPARWLTCLSAFCRPHARLSITSTSKLSPADLPSPEAMECIIVTLHVATCAVIGRHLDAFNHAFFSITQHPAALRAAPGVVNRVNHPLPTCTRQPSTAAIHTPPPSIPAKIETLGYGPARPKCIASSMPRYPLVKTLARVPEISIASSVEIFPRLSLSSSTMSGPTAVPSIMFPPITVCAAAPYSYWIYCCAVALDICTLSLPFIRSKSNSCSHRRRPYITRRHHRFPTAFVAAATVPIRPVFSLVLGRAASVSYSSDTLTSSFREGPRSNEREVPALMFALVVTALHAVLMESSRNSKDRVSGNNVEGAFKSHLSILEAFRTRWTPFSSFARRISGGLFIP